MSEPPVVVNVEPFQGLYRRKWVTTVTEHRVQTDLEDDFHHFSLTLHHNGSEVLAIDAMAERTPYSTCSESTDMLKAFIGLPLPGSIKKLREYAESSHQCTHLLDMLGLAVTHLGTPGETTYDVSIAEHSGNRQVGEVSKNGSLIWRLEVLEQIIQSPAELAGRSIQELPRWMADVMSSEQAEAAMILRRTFHIAIGRRLFFGKYHTVKALNAPATCYTFQPEQAERGVKLDSHRDFTDTPEQLLTGLE